MLLYINICFVSSANILCNGNGLFCSRSVSDGLYLPRYLLVLQMYHTTISIASIKSRHSITAITITVVLSLSASSTVDVSQYNPIIENYSILIL